MRWDAARARSRETPRKYVQCGPVGMRLDTWPSGTEFNGSRRILNEGEAACCDDCGHHVCSCDRNWLAVGDVLVGIGGPHRDQVLVVLALNAHCGGTLGVRAIDATGKEGSKPKWWRNGYLRECFERVSVLQDVDAKHVADVVLDPRRLEWPDGSKHLCTCTDFSEECAFALDADCQGHPPIVGSCERHGMKWREGQECWLCKDERDSPSGLKFVGGGEELPLPPAEKRVSVCLGCGLKRGAHRSDCHVLHTAIATMPPQPIIRNPPLSDRVYYGFDLGLAQGNAQARAMQALSYKTQFGEIKVVAHPNYYGQPILLGAPPKEGP